MRRLLRWFSLKSLLVKYLLIVLAALVLMPFVLLSTGIMLNLQGGAYPDAGLYEDASRLERLWHEEAAGLGPSPSPAETDAAVRAFLAAYTLAGGFWVDAGGRTHLAALSLDGEALPDDWTPADVARFIKSRYDGDPFTVVAMLGEAGSGGFMVFEVPRSAMQPDIPRHVQGNAILLTGALAALTLFMTVSLLFFFGIRKRLVRLERAMATPGESGFPATVEALRDDEIGKLERAFNTMIGQLEAGRARELQEEALRRDLIAKLSHDLRTPLTTIQGHAFRLQQEQLTERGKESVELIMAKIGFLSRLIENLLSYSLLAAGKYPYRPRQVDVVRTARTLFAGWYPAFEQEGFAIESDIPDEPFYWLVDPEWLERVLDNYLQNVLRHAKSGRYIGFRVEPDEGGRIVLADRGPGMSAETAAKGAGVGLSIAALMLKEMQLRADVSTGPAGTVLTIAPVRTGHPSSSSASHAPAESTGARRR